MCLYLNKYKQIYIYKYMCITFYVVGFVEHFHFRARAKRNITSLRRRRNVSIDFAYTT